MGRHAEVSYEQFRTAAEAIQSRGFIPGVRSLRAELGVGSNTTIAAFLDRWRREEEERHLDQRRLPPELHNAVFTFLDQETAKSHTRLMADLDECKQQVLDLSNENERQDQLALEQLNQIAGLVEGKAQLEGIQTQLRTELGGAREELAEARNNAEQSRIALAMAQPRLNKLASVANKLCQARTDRDAERLKRILAERASVLLDVKKAAVEQRLADTCEAVARAEKSAKELAENLNKERERRITAELSLAVLTAAQGPVANSLNPGIAVTESKSTPGGAATTDD